MKYYFVFFLFYALRLVGFSQNLVHPMDNEPGKPNIDTGALTNWSTVDRPSISNDGNHVTYFINNGSTAKHTLVIQQVFENQKIQIDNVEKAIITPDSKHVVFLKSKDRLGIASLIDFSIKYVSGVKSFLIPENGNGEWLAFQIAATKEVILINLTSEKENRFGSISDYLFNDKGTVLILQTELVEKGKAARSLKWIVLADLSVTTIWNSTSNAEENYAMNFVFDQSNTQLAYLENSKGNGINKRLLWYYKDGMKKAVPLVSDSSITAIGLKLFNISSFSKDGCRLFIIMTDNQIIQGTTSGINVDVWSYSDIKLQSQQLKEDDVKLYNTIVRIIDKVVIQLEMRNETLVKSPFEDSQDSIVLLAHNNGGDEGSEWYWNPACKKSYYIVSTQDGSRKLFRGSTWMQQCNSFQLSPQGKYIIYYNSDLKNFFSYEIATGTVINITNNIKTKWTGFNRCDLPTASKFPRGVAGWLKDDQYLLIYDRYDIWKIDPTGKTPPNNLTNGYGRKHNTIFNVGVGRKANVGILKDEEIILNAFKRDSKLNGFFRKRIDVKGDPEVLTMSSVIYYATRTDDYDDYGMKPLKAKHADVYIVQRMTASESPNYFATKDFKAFIPISSVYPEQEYNWLTTQLLSWKTIDGQSTQGILYKPQNFDPSKKYPVILNYYEINSGGLNNYIKPDFCQGNINIPLFVSNGYLVFVPDLHYQVGKPGESVVNFVISAVNYLSEFSFVDRKKMAVQGHSFGGYETNFLVTHTKIFAAACSSAGPSDFVSGYNGLLSRSGSSSQFFYEVHQFRIGHTLWSNPNSYIYNSPIFYADRVTTPLLLMNNKNDAVVAFSQGVEFFTALRRLNKKAWMLQYDEGGHGVFGKDAVDYTIRLRQFFDHYLKEAPAPIWLTQGIPARLKQIETGYAYDPSGNCCKDCKVCRYWNEKMKKDSIATMHEIERRKEEEHWQ